MSSERYQVLTWILAWLGEERQMGNFGPPLAHPICALFRGSPPVERRPFNPCVTNGVLWGKRGSAEPRSPRSGPPTPKPRRSSTSALGFLPRPAPSGFTTRRGFKFTTHSADTISLATTQRRGGRDAQMRRHTDTQTHRETEPETDRFHLVMRAHSCIKHSLTKGLPRGATLQ